MPIKTTANSKISIGTTAPKTTAAEYVTDTFTLISNVTDLGSLSAEAEILIRKYVDKDYVGKLKALRDGGTMTVVVDRDSADLGYKALIAAEKTDGTYNFKVELDDRPVGTSPKNSIFYFSAIVASAKNTFGGPGDVPSTSFDLAVVGKLIEVPASQT